MSVFCLLLGACSSHDAQSPQPSVKTKYEWDHARIREGRAAEAAQTAKDAAEKPSSSEDASQCQVLNHEQMVRSKLSGCQKLDPRAGMGENKYCCPKQ